MNGLLLFWILFFCILCSVVLVTGRFVALIFNPNMKERDLAQAVLVFVLAAGIFIAALLLTASDVGTPFSTINKSLSGV